MAGEWSNEWLYYQASRIVSGCAALVLLAVARNFLLADPRAPVQRERRSLVATGTMLLFFVGHYELIHHRLGLLPIGPRALAVGLTAVGLVLVVVGAVVNLLGRLSLAGNWSNQAVVYESQDLVTSGVYGYVRHPLYASLIWMFCGAALAFHNGAALLATLLVFLPAMHYRARLEEGLLAQRFPDYAAYSARTRRFLPWPRRAR